MLLPASHLFPPEALHAQPFRQDRHRPSAHRLDGVHRMLRGPHHDSGTSPRKDLGRAERGRRWANVVNSSDTPGNVLCRIRWGARLKAEVAALLLPSFR